MFKCKQSVICLHVGDVCDDNIDGPEGDDEYLCSLNFIPCPKRCLYLTFVIRCWDIEHSINHANSMPHYIVTIENSKKYILHHFLLRFKFIMHLTLRQNLLQTICIGKHYFSEMLVVDAGHNNLKEILSNCFVEAPNLMIIKLNDNHLVNIERYAFHNLKKLFYLNLMDNFLKEISPDIIYKCPKLNLLSIKNNSFRYISQLSFKNYNFDILISDNYKICCLKPPGIKCSTNPPWYKSCDILLASLPIQISFYCLLTLIFTLNVTSIIIQRIGTKIGPFEL